MWLGEGAGLQSSNGCHPPPQTGEGPATRPAAQGPGWVPRPGLVGHGEEQASFHRQPAGSSLAWITFFRPTLCLSQGGDPFVPQDSAGQEAAAFAKLRAKDNSACPITALQAGQAASEVSGKASPARSPRGPEASARRRRTALAELSKQLALIFKPLPEK